MKKSAEALKNEMRQMIEGLRGKFRRLLTENDQLTLDLKIPREVREEYSFLLKQQNFDLGIYS